MWGDDGKFQPTKGTGRNQSQTKKGTNYLLMNQQSSRQIPTSCMEPAQPKPKPDDFSSILECPVCFMIPDEDIYNCENGHSVCGNCVLRLVKCALCSAPFNGSRNFVVMSLLAHFKKFDISFDGSKSLSASNGQLLDCKYKMEGCEASVKNSELGKHDESCEYRPVRCKAAPEKGCPWDTHLKLSEYFKHLLEYHQIKGLNEPSGVFTKIDRLFMGMEINSNWRPFYLKFDGKTFLRFASIRDRKFSWWVQLIGSDKECKNYRAVISLQCPKKSDVRISWSVPVFSIRCNKSVIDANNIATISSNQILPFCSLDEAYEGRVATHTWFCNIALSRIDTYLI